MENKLKHVDKNYENQLTDISTRMFEEVQFITS